MKQLVKNIENLRSVANEYNRFISKEKTKRATIVGLEGDLGSGKTTFTKEFARSLGVVETVTSPTFVIQKKYRIQKSTFFKQFIHIDAYRLKSGSELKVLDWDTINSDSTNLIFIEWPEQVNSVLPKDVHRVHFTFIDETTRRIEW